MKQQPVRHGRILKLSSAGLPSKPACSSSAVAPHQLPAAPVSDRSEGLRPTWSGLAVPCLPRRQPQLADALGRPLPLLSSPTAALSSWPTAAGRLRACIARLLRPLLLGAMPGLPPLEVRLGQRCAALRLRYHLLPWPVPLLLLLCGARPLPVLLRPLRWLMGSRTPLLWRRRRLRLHPQRLSLRLGLARAAGLKAKRKAPAAAILLLLLLLLPLLRALALWRSCRRPGVVAP